jgi:hypothetical protein
VQIELHILLGSAAIAVIIVIGIIRLISGAKNARLTQEGCEKFIADNEPNIRIKTLVLNKTKTAALLEDEHSKRPYLLRVFGNKIVCQQLHNPKSVTRVGNSITIAREGLSYPPITFEFESQSDADRCVSIFKEGTLS